MYWMIERELARYDDSWVISCDLNDPQKHLD